MSAPDGQTLPGVAICIPTFNRAALLDRTLRSVARMEFPAGLPVEVLVIDNNCTDGTAEVAAAAAALSPVPLRRVSEPRPGLCHARNRALAAAAREHVALLDDDVEVAPGWIVAYMEAVERRGAACVVGPVTAVFEREPPPWMTTVILDSLNSSYSRKGDTMMRVPEALAHQVPGCNFGVRRELAIALGGFDPNLDRMGGGLLSGGDWEFGERLVKAGATVVYHPGCAVRHLITAEKMSKRHLRRRWFGFGRTVAVLARKRGAPAGVLRRARMGLNALRLGAETLRCRLQGQPGPAFQKELEALRTFGILWG